MGEGFKEVASLRGNDKLYAENLSKIDWSAVGGRVEEKLEQTLKEKVDSLTTGSKYYFLFESEILKENIITALDYCFQSGRINEAFPHNDLRQLADEIIAKSGLSNASGK